MSNIKLCFAYVPLFNQKHRRCSYIRGALSKNAQAKYQAAVYLYDLNQWLVGTKLTSKSGVPKDEARRVELAKTLLSRIKQCDKFNDLSLGADKELKDVNNLGLEIQLFAQAPVRSPRHDKVRVCDTRLSILHFSMADLLAQPDNMVCLFPRNCMFMMILDLTRSQVDGVSLSKMRNSRATEVIAQRDELLKVAYEESSQRRRTLFAVDEEHTPWLRTYDRQNHANQIVVSKTTIVNLSQAGKIREIAMRLPGDMFLAYVLAVPKDSPHLPSALYYDHHMRLAMTRLLGSSVDCKQGLWLLDNLRLVKSSGVLRAFFKHDKTREASKEQTKALLYLVLEIFNEMISTIAGTRGHVYFPDMDEQSLPEAEEADTEGKKRNRPTSSGQQELTASVKQMIHRTSVFFASSKVGPDVVKETNIYAGILDNVLPAMAGDDCESLTRSALLMTRCMIHTLKESVIPLESLLWNVAQVATSYTPLFMVCTINTRNMRVDPILMESPEYALKQKKEIERDFFGREEELWMDKRRYGDFSAERVQRQFPDKTKMLDKELVCHATQLMVPSALYEHYKAKGIWEQRKETSLRLGKTWTDPAPLEPKTNLPTFISESTDYSPGLQCVDMLRDMAMPEMERDDRLVFEFQTLMQTSFAFFDAFKQRSSVRMSNRFNIYETASVLYDPEEYPRTGCGEFLLVDCNTHTRAVRGAHLLGMPIDPRVCDIAVIPTTFGQDLFAQRFAQLSDLMPALSLAMVDNSYNKPQLLLEPWTKPKTVKRILKFHPEFNKCPTQEVEAPEKWQGLLVRIVDWELFGQDLLHMANRNNLVISGEIHKWNELFKEIIHLRVWGAAPPKPPAGVGFGASEMVETDV